MLLTRVFVKHLHLFLYNTTSSNSKEVPPSSKSTSQREELERFENDIHGYFRSKDYPKSLNFDRLIALMSSIEDQIRILPNRTADKFQSLIEPFTPCPLSAVLQRVVHSGKIKGKYEAMWKVREKQGAFSIVWTRYMFS